MEKWFCFRNLRICLETNLFIMLKKYCNLRMYFGKRLVLIHVLKISTCIGKLLTWACLVYILSGERLLNLIWDREDY